MHNETWAAVAVPRSFQCFDFRWTIAGTRTNARLSVVARGTRLRESSMIIVVCLSSESSKVRSCNLVHLALPPKEYAVRKLRDDTDMFVRHEVLGAPHM